MTKIFHRTALAVGLLLASPAFAAGNETVTYKGSTFVYSVTEKGNAKIIEGVEQATNRPFRLRVSNGRVDGRIDGSAVSFSLRDVKHVASTATSTQVAAR